MAYDSNKLQELFKRVYNNKMIADAEKGVFDEKDIKEYCEKVFGDGSVTPDPSLLHQFNNLVVKIADEIAKPKVTEMVSVLASMKTAKLGEIVKYEIPTKIKAKVIWSANGSGVDLTRAEGKKSYVATPKKFSFGAYYEPLDLVQDSVTNFRKLVDDIADAKVKLYFQEISKLIQAAIGSGKIPTGNVKVGNNLTLGDYNKIASRLTRLGGDRPVFVADTLMIDYFANQQATDPVISKLLTDPVKAALLSDMNTRAIGRTVAVNLVNPFIDEALTKTELPVNIGYMFAGGAKTTSGGSVSPFIVTEYGTMRQFTEIDPEDERVKLKITQEADVTLLFGEAIGYIKEDVAVQV